MTCVQTWIHKGFEIMEIFTTERILAGYSKTANKCKIHLKNIRTVCRYSRILKVLDFAQAALAMIITGKVIRIGTTYPYLHSVGTPY